MNVLQLPELNRIYNQDALAFAKTLPDNSINCVITSPAYWGLRDYGYDGQYGLEATLQEWLEKHVILFREIRRALHSDGTCWINMGDSYASSVNGRSAADTKELGDDDRTFRDKPFSTVGNGLKPKDLCGQPWRLAFALQDDGWWLRQDIIWAKPNPMPESIADRCTKSHEYVFLLTKSERYWFDTGAIREPAVNGDPNPPRGSKGVVGQLNAGNRVNRVSKDGTVLPDGARIRNGLGASTLDGDAHLLTHRNKRSVWTIATEPTKEAHFAIFPRKLIEPMILAGCPDKVCCQCGAPWIREVEKSGGTTGQSWVDHKNDLQMGMSAAHNRLNESTDENGNAYQRIDLGFSPQCECNADTHPGVVYDPFMGSGTTAIVARSLGRDYVGSELNADYIAIAEERLRMPFDAHSLIKADKPLPKLRVQIGDITLEQLVLFDE